MKTILDVACSHGLGIYDYNGNKSFRLVDHRRQKEMSVVKMSSVWVCSCDNATVIMPFLSRRALSIAVIAMYGSVVAFLFVDRSGTPSLLTETEYQALINQ